MALHMANLEPMFRTADLVADERIVTVYCPDTGAYHSSGCLNIDHHYRIEEGAYAGVTVRADEWRVEWMPIPTPAREEE